MLHLPARRFCPALVLVAVLLAPGRAWADEPEAEAAPESAAPAADAAESTAPETESAPEAEDAAALLDKATATKLSAETLADLNRVIDLSRQAIEAGLDEANETFAKELLAGTLSERAEILCLELFERPVTPNRARRLVRMAMADLEETIEINPEQPQTQFLLGRMYAHLGQVDKAKTALDAAIRLSDSDPAAKSQALLIRAGLQREPDDAQADYDAAAELTPKDPGVLRFRGMHYLIRNNVEAALADFNAAIELEPENPDTYEARGMAEEAAEKFEDAMASYSKAIELEPNSPSALVRRSRLRAIQGNFPAALADVETAMRLRPGSVQALLLHANLLGTTGKVDQALAELNVLRQVLPDSPEVLMQIGTLHLSNKEPEKAIDAFNHLIALDPQNAAALRGRADTYLNLGKHAEAVADYEEAVKAEPEDASVLNNLAWVLATSPNDELRNGTRSIELAKRACEVTEYKQAHILSTLAAGYAETGDFETAITWSQKAVELGEEPTKAQLEQELKSYQAGKPWRETAPPELPAVERTARSDSDAAPSQEDTARAKRGS